ncbi:uncharacterized protein LOC141899712 isoform X2 [Tubulanus polymorphus]|uniref:uncharacterized protein LOC141899712 isoform X2 n=1 Tax=Tubulanus polymorphus TaxID=672921 RepID=UPI003DA605D3
MASVKAKLIGLCRLSREGATPLDWKVLGVVLSAMFIGHKEEDKGYYVGILLFAMYGGRVMASYFWGWLSDRVGRRPIILITLALQTLTTVTFGFCPTMIIALINRFFFGLTYGVIGVIKAVIYESSDNSNQGAYISIMVLGFGCGKMIGPAISGFLAQPVEKYPNTFAAGGFFSQFPFILPCLPVFFVYIVAIIHAVIHLKETLQKNKPGEKENGLYVCEKCQILQSQRKINDYMKSCETLNMFYETYSKSPSALLDVQNSNRSTHDLNQMRYKYPWHLKNDRSMSFSAPNLTNGAKNHRYSESSENMKPLMQADVKRTCLLCSKDETENMAGNSSGISPECEESRMSKFKKSALYLSITSHEVRISVILYAVMAAAVTGIDEVFPVWASTATHLDGLGFETNDIGSVLGILSVPVLIIQLFLFAFLERKIGARKTFMIVCLLAMIMTALLPITHLIQDKTVLLWISLVFILGIIRLSGACCLSAVSMFVNNCSSPDMSGAINGVSLVLISFGRGIGPLFSGSMFAWSISSGVNLGYPFDVNFAFVMLSICFAICIFCDLFLPFTSLNNGFNALTSK